MPSPTAATTWSAAMSTPRVLGVDEFALRKGHNYGTILVDIETRQPVDLLPGRDTSMVAGWLADHPGIEGICRGRSAYAEAGRLGAPDAVHVADAGTSGRTSLRPSRRRSSSTAPCCASRRKLPRRAVAVVEITDLEPHSASPACPGPPGCAPLSNIASTCPKVWPNDWCSKGVPLGAAMSLSLREHTVSDSLRSAFESARV